MKALLVTLVTLCLAASCATSRAQNLGPPEIMTCELARRVIVELDSDALIQAGGIVNKRISPEGQITLYIYLEANQEYRRLYEEWILKHCKEA